MSLANSVTALAKGTLAYGFAGALTRAVNLLLLPIYTAYLAPSEYGVLTLIMVLVAIVIPVASIGLGVSISLIYFEQAETKHRAQTIWTAFALLCACGLVALVPAMIEADQISRLIFGEINHSDLVIIAAANAWFVIVGQPFATHLQLERRLSAFLLCSSATAATLVVASLWFVIELQHGAHGILEAQLISQCVSAVAFGGATCLRLRPGFSLALARRLAAYGLPLVPSFASLMVLQQTPQIMLQAVDSLGTLGVYGVGAAMGAAMSFAVSGFTSAWPSIFLPYSSQPGTARELIRRVSGLYVIGMGALNLLFFVWARPVTFVMTAPPFHDAYLVVGLAACSQLLWGFFSVLLPAVYFAKQVSIVNLTQATAAAFFVPICWLLVAWSPLLGAGISLAAGGGLLCIVQHLWNRSRGDRYLQVEYPWKRLAAFGAWYVLIAVGFTLPNQLNLLLDITLSLMGTILVMILAVSFLTPDDRARLRTAVQLAVKWRP